MDSKDLLIGLLTMDMSFHSIDALLVSDKYKPATQLGAELFDKHVLPILVIHIKIHKLWVEEFYTLGIFDTLKERLLGSFQAFLDTCRSADPNISFANWIALKSDWHDFTKLLYAHFGIFYNVLPN